MAAAAEAKEQVFLEADDEIRGQKYVCLSFLTPSRTLLRNKDQYFFSQFMTHYAMDYKIRATESFVLGKLRDIQNVLSDVSLDLANVNLVDASGNTARDAAVERVTKARETLARQTASDLEAHVKANLTDFKESTIVEEYEKFMTAHEQRLEDEFHKQNNFQTTVHGLKVRGVYSNMEQATARAKTLHKKDPYFNVYVADVGEWLPWDPNPEQISESEYLNEDLNKLMRQYKENAAEREAHFEEMKRQKMADAAAAAKTAKEGATAQREAQLKKLKEQVVFGEQEQEQEGGAAGRDLFAAVEDLALQRKREVVVAAAEETISHAP
jgi:hypothetical protein